MGSEHTEVWASLYGRLRSVVGDLGTNISRFVTLLRRYSEHAQFIVVTHQKRTMEAADVLYGVTMGGDGVSQIVSRRLPREDAVAMSAA